MTALNPRLWQAGSLTAVFLAVLKVPQLFCAFIIPNFKLGAAFVRGTLC